MNGPLVVVVVDVVGVVVVVVVTCGTTQDDCWQTPFTPELSGQMLPSGSGLPTRHEPWKHSPCRHGWSGSLH